MRRLHGLILFSILLAAGSCRNVPAEERAELLHEAESAQPSEQEEKRSEMRLILAGDGAQPASTDPHLRATAAQALGQLGDPSDATVLLDVLAGMFPDTNRMVRMEAAIALGKLAYAGPKDETRRNVLMRLSNRIAFERTESGRYMEEDFLVRSAMVNSVAALGGQDAASALHDVAKRLLADGSALETSIFMDSADDGLYDLCLDGLVRLTGVSPQAAAEDRQSRDDPSAHLDWWAERIAEMRGS